MKKFLVICLIIAFFLSLGFSFEAQAQSKFLQGLTNTGQQVDIYAGGPLPLSVYIANIVKGLLTLLGIIFVGLLVYGGFTYMTSRGNEEKINKSKGTLKAAVIGIFLIISGYTITYFIAATLESPGENGRPFYREDCENPGYVDYNSLNCCYYRAQVFNQYDPYCCNNYKDFCRSFFSQCGKTAIEQCPDR